MRGALVELLTLGTAHKNPAVWNPQANKDPEFPQELLITPSGLQKGASNGSHGLCLKLKPQVKCYRSLPAR